MMKCIVLLPWCPMFLQKSCHKNNQNSAFLFGFCSDLFIIKTPRNPQMCFSLKSSQGDQAAQSESSNVCWS